MSTRRLNRCAGQDYVGFRVGDQEVGLDPHGHSQGMTGPVGYWHVDDIHQTLKLLLDAGAEVQRAASDVGGGKLIASVKDADGNVIGLIEGGEHATVPQRQQQPGTRMV